jgi:hypothetical protein
VAKLSKALSAAVQAFCAKAAAAARSPAGHSAASACPELQAAAAHSCAEAARTQAVAGTGDVSPNPGAARTHRAMARPRVVDRIQAITHKGKGVAHNPVAAGHSEGVGRTRVARKRRAIPRSRMVAGHTRGVGHSPVAARRRTAMAHNRAVGGVHSGLQREMRRRQAALSR